MGQHYLKKKHNHLSLYDDSVMAFSLEIKDGCKDVCLIPLLHVQTIFRCK